MDDRGSTEDWLLPEDRESLAAANGAPVTDERIEEALSRGPAAAEGAASAEQRGRGGGNHGEGRMEQML